MPKPTTSHERALYRATKAAVHASLIASRTFRSKPQAAAHLAGEHARATVMDERISKRNR